MKYKKGETLEQFLKRHRYRRKTFVRGGWINPVSKDIHVGYTGGASTHVWIDNFLSLEIDWKTGEIIGYTVTDPASVLKCFKKHEALNMVTWKPAKRIRHEDGRGRGWKLSRMDHVNKNADHAGR